MLKYIYILYLYIYTSVSTRSILDGYKLIQSFGMGLSTFTSQEFVFFCGYLRLGHMWYVAPRQVWDRHRSRNPPVRADRALGLGARRAAMRSSCGPALARAPNNGITMGIERDLIGIQWDLMGFNDVNVNRIYPLIFQRSELENDLFFKGKSPCLSSINGPFSVVMLNRQRGNMALLRWWCWIFPMCPPSGEFLPKESKRFL